MNNENFDLVTNDENEEFTVEFGEVINDGGTHDYNELDNQPQINGHTLEGNKTTSELGIPVYSAGENITISDDYVISATGGGGGSGVNSVNGQVGDVVLTTSDLENTSDYQTGTEVESAISTAIAGKQDTLTAGNNITISNNTISATDTTYTAGTGLALNGTQFSVDTTAIATQSDLTAGLATKQDILTAGANVQINNNTISATDTTYSDFTGTDGTAAGAAGLVPAPATTDAGKFLKADGTWDTAGSAINVVQTTGTSTTDVMSQNATTSMVFADPSTRQKVQIGADAVARASYSVSIGRRASTYGTNSVAVGDSTQAGYESGVAVGSSAKCTDNYATAIGAYAKANMPYSVAVGTYAVAEAKGEMNIGTDTQTTAGYNNSNYRLLTGLYDPQSDHDAATKGYVDNSLLGKANKISVVQTSASTIEINPNTFYKFGEVASLNITLASITDNTIYNEYMFEFVSGTTATTLTLPSSIKWLETPTIDANKIYQCSIVDNVGLLVGVANV